MEKYITHNYPLDIGVLCLWIEFSELGNTVAFIDKDPSNHQVVFFDNATTEYVDKIISAMNDIRNILWKIENPAEVSE